MTESPQAYTVICDGKTVRTFRTAEEAEELRKMIIAEPSLFIKIHVWHAGEFYPYVDFEETREEEIDRR